MRARGPEDERPVRRNLYSRYGPKRAVHAKPKQATAAISPTTAPANEKASSRHSATRPPQGKTKAVYFAVGITNSAPLPMLSGQRCMMLFCLV